MARSSSALMRLRLDTSRALPDYAILYLQSLPGLVELRKNAKHAINQSSINQEDVKGAMFNLPPLPEQQEIVRRVEGLFALGCFEFKRPHDSFGGRRRALAFEILGKVGLVVDLPEVVHTALKVLKKAQSVESRQAAEFLRVYFAERDPPPNDELIDELLSLAERTNSRSTAFAALNTLVEIGTISEFEAVDRMDDWKSKRR
ncbi:MAG: restriction endonuclease subunit S [Verrucomicrobia bacterium]|nr:restriction endonuclease subunit S [Verrucomicrobiota bacterium]